MPDKILFVDDEPAVLGGYQRLLRTEFQVDVAVGAAQGLALIKERGPFSVVISDMRMPYMNGAQFLAQLRKDAPETVRMLLTGYTDIDAAMDAVNEGNIFRFLTKPCQKEQLVNAISAGIKQYRLITAERELLEETLVGSITVLTDVLSAASPAAFGRSMRIAQCVRYLAAKSGLSSQWRFDVAATLSQLGCITLDPALIERVCEGTSLSPDDQARFNAHPRVAMEILSVIPRLGPIAWMIGQQLVKDIPDVVPGLPESSAKDVVLGAKILKLAIAFCDLRAKGLSIENAISRLHGRLDEFDHSLVDDLIGIPFQTTSMTLRSVLTHELRVGMILRQEIKDKLGMMIAASGQEISTEILCKIEVASRAGMIGDEFMAMVPAEFAELAT